MIYFLECDGFIKIGYTNGRAGARVRNIQSANPHEVRLLFACQGTIEQEQELQRRLWEFHIRGEWFVKSPEFMMALEDACQVASKRKQP